MIISRGSPTCNAAPIIDDEKMPGFLHVTCPGCSLDYIVSKT